MRVLDGGEGANLYTITSQQERWGHTLRHRPADVEFNETAPFVLDLPRAVKKDLLLFHFSLSILLSPGWRQHESTVSVLFREHYKVLTILPLADILTHICLAIAGEGHATA